MRLHVFDALNGIAHDLRAFLVAAQPRKQAALIQAPLLDEEGGKLVRRDRLEARDLRRARRQVGEEKISRRRALDAARLLHLLVLGEKLQRHRIRAADQLVQENAELASGAIDHIASRRRLGFRQALEPDQMALDFLGVGGDRVEAHHLQRARCLVHMGTRLLERGDVARRGLVCGERLQPAS